MCGTSPTKTSIFLREKNKHGRGQIIIIGDETLNFGKKLKVGVCHPGSSSAKTGIIKNAHNSPWLNDKNFNLDISNKLNKNVLCENDANCFALSEAFDGSAQHHKIVFGIILLGPSKSDFWTYQILCDLGQKIGVSSFCIDELPFIIQSRQMAG